MCLAVPGQIMSLQEKFDQPYGMVDFNGSTREVNLGFTPSVHPGDWVLVHAGFSINTLEESEAIETWKYLEESAMLDEVDELNMDLGE